MVKVGIVVAVVSDVVVVVVVDAEVELLKFNKWSGIVVAVVSDVIVVVVVAEVEHLKHTY